MNKRKWDISNGTKNEKRREWYYLPTPPLGQDMTQGQFFKAEFNRFEFRVFLLLD